MHFDDLELVRVMSRLEEEGRLAHMAAVERMSEMGGEPGHDAERRTSFGFCLWRQRMA